jgi:DNA modification methylase
MHERLSLMKELLSEQGSIYVHVDWHISHYIKLILDEIFGLENFRNEIIWYYPAASAQTKRFFVRSYDSILFYTKSDDYIFNDDPNIYMEYSKRVQNAVQKDENGYFYYRGGSHNGKKLSRKVYIEKKGVFPRDVWTKIPYIRANTLEYQGFSTQKPERLLKRIILASSNKNSIIADFFCGTGTTLAVAEKLSRRWIGCDLNWHAIKTSITRLLNLQNSNDIFNWDEIYGNSSNSFEIFRLINNKHQGKIPEEFLNNKSNTLRKNKKPQLAVDLKRNENKVNLSIERYFFPYLDQLNKKIKTKIRDWKELIDYFAVDFNYNNNEFIPQWISYRTPKIRKMRFNTGWYDYEKVKKNKIEILIKIIDIFGFESTKNISLTL